jgi:hypothetical protein
MVMIFVLALRQATTLDPDLWWHLSAGELIVNSGAIPHTDNFSFTKNGAEWVAHEWLSEVVIYGVYKFAGLVGLVCAFSLVIVGALWMVYRRCEGRPYVASIAVLLAAASSSPLFGVRPQMITWLLASIYVTLLERFSREKRSRPLWWLLPIMLLWVNLHAGFALGLALIGLYMVCAVLDGSPRLVLPLAISLLICIAIVPLNPNGFRMFTYPYETLTSPAMAALIEEWASPDFHKLMYLPFALFLLGTAALLATSPKRVRAGELFLFLVTAFAALRSVRHIPIFALIAAPIFANHLWEILKSRGWDKLINGAEIAPTVGKLALNLVLLITVTALAASRILHFARNQKTYETIRNPVAAVDFMLAQRLPAPIYNKYGWGGYLIHRLYPTYRVYIDGRADVYGDQFFAETIKTYDGIGDWAGSLDRYGINTVLIAPDAALASLLRNDHNDWKVVYEDNQAVIFTRTSPNVPS